jgi:hypothetical protein
LPQVCHHHEVHIDILLLFRDIEYIVDDPAIFGVGKHPASYDFWMVTMTWSSFDLATMKYLALSSIEHSLVSDPMKQKMRQQWQLMWDQWIDWSMDLIGK